jgi:hypothetical protein
MSTMGRRGKWDRTYVVLLNRSNAGRRVKVVEGVVLPEDGAHTQGVRNVADAVIDVTVRRPPALNGNTENVLDRLLRVVELSEGLLIREGGHVAVRPVDDRVSMSVQRGDSSGTDQVWAQI